uniref:Disease resistance N-terminal domain-containing protein n=1 Tax=Quercus lobata TaxID=97700 RepID=A0A7N2LR21_QUELO
MQCFLKDADKKQNSDESVQNRVLEIREATYDVQDVIETFALEIASKYKDNNPIKRFVPSFNNSKKLYKVGSKIESIKTRISDLTRSLQTYGVTPMKEEGSSLALDRQRKLRWSYSHIVEEYIVGLDENTKEVVGHLVISSKILLTTRNRDVASHIGPGVPLNIIVDGVSVVIYVYHDDAEFRISKDMENLGREMVARCAGLPLAIIVLGGLLATKETLDE